MIHLIPGDPVRAALGPRAPQSLVDARRHSLWLDPPLPRQFGHYVGGALTRELGVSLHSTLPGVLAATLGTRASSTRPVTQVAGERLPNTAKLVALACAAIKGLAVPLGMAA